MGLGQSRIERAIVEHLYIFWSLNLRCLMDCVLSHLWIFIYNRRILSWCNLQDTHSDIPGGWTNILTSFGVIEWDFLFQSLFGLVLQVVELFDFVHIWVHTGPWSEGVNSCCHLVCINLCWLWNWPLRRASIWNWPLRRISSWFSVVLPYWW